MQIYTLKNKLISLSFSRSSSFFSSLPLFLCYIFLFFFLSLTLCHSLFFILLLFSQLLLSLFFSHFLSLAFTISISFCLSFSPSFFESHSLFCCYFSPCFFFFSYLFLSSIPVSFLSLCMLCATLHGRESIVGLFGFRFRRVARFPFTATYIAKDDAFYSRGPPLRSFCGYTSSKLNSPSFFRLTLCDPCDTDFLGFFKGQLIYQTSFLDHDVENKHEQAASHLFNFRPFSFLLSFTLFPFFLSPLYFLSLYTRSNYPMER